MKIKSLIYTLLMMVMFSLLPTGCNDDNDFINTDPEDDKVHWTIGVRLPSAVNGETRAFGDGLTGGTGTGGYYEFNDLYVAVFAEIDGVSYLEEFVRADNTVPTWDEENDIWNFGATLSKTNGPRRLHLIANYPGLTMGFGEEGQLVGRLMANGANHDVYWNSVNVSMIDEGYETQVQGVPLIRNYVKIQLNDGRADKSKFELTGYALYNVPTRGTAAPYNPQGSPIFANYVDESGNCRTYTSLLTDQGYKGNEPNDDGTLLSKAINWITPAQDGTLQPSYIYERNHSNTTSPTCMLIKGKYSNEGSFNEVEETFYKLDFVYEDANTHSNVYYNLLRNFVYTMNLSNVTGAGYNTVTEAINAPASNNIGGDAVAEDYTNISDGSGRLFVSTTFMLFTRDQDAYLYYKYIPSINSTTTSNDAVTITAPAGNVLQTAASVAGTDETSGIYQGWRKVTLNPKAVPAISQTQELIFAVNNTALQRKVKLLLSRPYNLTVAVANAERTGRIVPKTVKSELHVDITLPADLDVALFPLRMLISSKDNTIYAKPGTNMPAEVLDGKYGFIREISLEEYQESLNKTFSSSFLTNCENSATVVYVDNEYFATGKDNFGNQTLGNVSLGTTIAVDVQQIYGRYPQRIYNNGNNSGTESVTLTSRGNNLGTITIDRDNVTSGLTIQGSNELLESDEVVFTFTDKYWHGEDNWSDMTYTATATLSEISAGKKLVFTAQGAINRTTSVTIPANIPVTIEQINSRYPQKIYNSELESVTVSLNGNNLEEGKTISINSSKVTEGNTFIYSAGVGLDDELTFTFADNCWFYRNWSTSPATYTATATLAEIGAGAALNFTAQVPRMTELTIASSEYENVEIERIYGRYPQQIYGTGNNSGTETVTVTYNGKNVGIATIADDNSIGTITINSTKVTAGNITISNSEGITLNDELIFTFTDSYWHGKWSDNPITYRATATLNDILATNTKLVFQHVGEISKLTSLTITKETFSDITVKRETITSGRTTYYVYPQKIHNNNNNNNTTQNNNGEETVTVYYNNTQVGTMTITGIGGNPTTFTVAVTGNSITINDNNGIDVAKLEFSFTDNKCTKLSNNKYTFGTKTTYKATCNNATIEDITDNNLSLDFTY